MPKKINTYWIEDLQAMKTFAATYNKTKSKYLEYKKKWTLLDVFFYKHEYTFKLFL